MDTKSEAEVTCRHQLPKSPKKFEGFDKHHVFMETAIQSLDALSDQLVQYIFTPKSAELDCEHELSAKDRETLKTSLALMRRLLVDAQSKFRKMVDDNRQLAARIDGSIHAANVEVNSIRAELQDTNKRLTELSGPAADRHKNNTAMSSNQQTEAEIAVLREDNTLLKAEVERLEKQRREYQECNKPPSPKASNQLSNQPNNQPSNQLSNQPNNQSSNQLSNQSSNQLSNQPNNQSSNQLSNQSSNQLSNQPNNQSSNQLSNQPSNQPSPKLATSAVDVSHSNLRLELIQAHHDLSRAREALTAMKSDRQRLRAEKVELLTQLQQLYCTLEDKEAELRDFIRSYEQRMRDSDASLTQLTAQKEEVERDHWNLLQRARAATDECLCLQGELTERDRTIQLLQCIVDYQQTQTQMQTCVLRAKSSYISQDSLLKSSSLELPPEAEGSAVSTELGRVTDATSCTTTAYQHDSPASLMPAYQHDSPASLMPAYQHDSPASLMPAYHDPGFESLHIIMPVLDPPIKGRPMPVLDPPIKARPSLQPPSHRHDSSLQSLHNLSGQHAPCSNHSGLSSQNLSVASDLMPPQAESSRTSCSGDLLLTPSGPPARAEDPHTHSAHCGDAPTTHPATPAHCGDTLITPSATPVHRRDLTPVPSSCESLHLHHSPSTVTTDIKYVDLKALRTKNRKSQSTFSKLFGRSQSRRSIAVSNPSVVTVCEPKTCHLPRRSNTIQFSGPLRDLITHDASAMSPRCSVLSQDNYGEKLSLLTTAQSLPLARWRAGHVLAWLEVAMCMPAYGTACAENIKSGKVSLLHGVELLRRVGFDKEVLSRRRSESEHTDTDPLVWTNHRVLQWLQSIDLHEYSDTLTESGIHGALLVLESAFNADAFAAALGIPAHKSYVRRHLGTELDTIIRPARAALEAGAGKKKWLDRPGGQSFERSFRSSSAGGSDTRRGSKRLSFRGSLGRALGRKVKSEIISSDDKLSANGGLNESKRSHSVELSSTRV